jgi:peptidyl-dipeptidase Dcp
MKTFIIVEIPHNAYISSQLITQNPIRMKKTGISFIALAMILSSCNTTKEQKKDMSNPFFSEYKTPFQTPPFSEIKLGHYVPAVEEGITEQINEIKAITDNKDEATFANTILAFDNSGDLLNKAGIFFNLNSANTNDEMQALARELTPKLSTHRDNIMLNKDLFKRVKAVYDKRKDLNLDKEQLRVVEKYYRDFERNGANLPEDKQAELRKLNDELSMLELKFGENVLAETNKTFKMVVDNEADLKGLPSDVIAAAADVAKKDSMTGKWVFTSICRKPLTPRETV